MESAIGFDKRQNRDVAGGNSRLGTKSVKMEKGTWDVRSGEATQEKIKFPIKFLRCFVASDHVAKIRKGGLWSSLFGALSFNPCHLDDANIIHMTIILFRIFFAFIHFYF